MMHFPKVPVVIVAAITKKDRSIGLNNELMWHIPDDLKYFKELTVGHPVIMGRKTFESIIAKLGKPLPGRTTIVLTRNVDYTYPEVEIAHSLEAAFAIAERGEPSEIHIGGGAELYEVALPYVSRLHLTLVDSDLTGDTFFPDYSKHFAVVSESDVMEHQGLTYQWVDLERQP